MSQNTAYTFTNSNTKLETETYGSEATNVRNVQFSSTIYNQEVYTSHPQITTKQENWGCRPQKAGCAILYQGW